jgi:pimeloyl-ACP methyl ester carboxylesterase
MAGRDTEALLLIAGLGQGSWVWRWVLPELSSRYRTVSFDNAGTGALFEQPARSSVSELADDAVAALRAEGGESAHVVGLSMGGYVALTLALARPEVVRSLVLAGTGAGGPDRVPRPKHVADAFRAALGTPPEEFGRRTMPYTFADGWADANAARFEEILAMRLERPTSYEAIEAHANACYGFYRAGREVERIEVPALVVHGDEDRIVPVENGRRLAERLPNAGYVELSGSGHNLPLEDPERFSRLVLEFLAALQGAS